MYSICLPCLASDWEKKKKPAASYSRNEKNPEEGDWAKKKNPCEEYSCSSTTFLDFKKVVEDNPCENMDSLGRYNKKIDKILPLLRNELNCHLNSNLNELTSVLQKLTSVLEKNGWALIRSTRKDELNLMPLRWIDQYSAQRFYLFPCLE